MSASVIRSRAMVTHAIDRHRWNEITDGAVLQEDGRIVEIGTYQELSRKHPNVAVVGSGKEVMLPGFVNGHHHIGLTPVQLGSPDMPLELWFVTRLVMRNVNLYLDTLYSAFEMIASGVTTVQHLHGRLPGKLDQVERGCDEAIRAYWDVGMRVSYSYAVRDQNRLVYQRDEDFIASLPSELRGPMLRWFERFQLTLNDNIALFEGLYGRYRDARRVKVQLAPANLHWCSDEALMRLADCSRKYDVPLHMHLLETAYQKEYARRRGGGTAVEYIDRFGLLGPRMTLGHGVYAWHGASCSWNQECGSLSVLQSARLVSHYARCIPSKALYRRCLQRCSDKGSYRTELKRPRVTEAKCNTGRWPIAHRHSRLPSCAVGIAP
jgi:cytosine/adenosine deaminase-related metal-dependent hydrolase